MFGPLWFGYRIVKYSTRRRRRYRRRARPTPTYRPRHIPSNHHCERCPTRTPAPAKTPDPTISDRPDGGTALICGFIGLAALVTAVAIVVNGFLNETFATPGAALAYLLCLAVAAITLRQVWLWATLTPTEKSEPPPRPPAREEPSPKIPPPDDGPINPRMYYSDRR